MLQDNDIMPFGMHKGKQMIDVPKNWLLWFYDEVNKTGDVQGFRLDVYTYIDFNYDIIENERTEYEVETKRSGFLVITKTGKRGIIYHDEARVNGKNKTYIVNSEYKETGERMLCDPMAMQIIGFIN